MKVTLILFDPTYAIQVYGVGATKLQCLFSSPVEIKQQACGKCYDSPFQLFLDTSINTLLTFQKHLHILQLPEESWAGCGWPGVLRFPNTLCNKSLLTMPEEHMFNMLNNKLESKTVLQSTS